MRLLSPSEFLMRIWPARTLKNETLELRIISREDHSISRRFFSSIPDFLSGAQKYIETHNVYFGVSTRFGLSGKKADCYRINTLWCDLDKRKVMDCLEYDDPDILVDSGGGVHAYWLLDNPIILRGEDSRQERIEANNRGRAKKFKGDIAAIDVSRILRVPGFLNYKYNPPRRVRAYSCHPSKNLNGGLNLIIENQRKPISKSQLAEMSQTSFLSD